MYENDSALDIVASFNEKVNAYGEHQFPLIIAKLIQEHSYEMHNECGVFALVDLCLRNGVLPTEIATAALRLLQDTDSLLETWSPDCVQERKDLYQRLRADIAAYQCEHPETAIVQTPHKVEDLYQQLYQPRTGR